MSAGGNYQVRIKRSAEHEMDSLPPQVFERVAAAILSLETAPRRRGVVKLQGQNAYRLRVSTYRVIFTIDDAARVVEVIAVRHRRDAYR